MKYLKKYEKKVNIINRYHISTLLEVNNRKSYDYDKVYIIKIMNDNSPYGDSYKFEVFYSYEFATDKLIKYYNKFKSLRKSRFDNNILSSFDSLKDAIEKLNNIIEENKIKKNAEKYNL